MDVWSQDVISNIPTVKWQSGEHVPNSKEVVRQVQIVGRVWVPKFPGLAQYPHSRHLVKPCAMPFWTPLQDFVTCCWKSTATKLPYWRGYREDNKSEATPAILLQQAEQAIGADGWRRLSAYETTQSRHLNPWDLYRTTRSKKLPITTDRGTYRRKRRQPIETAEPHEADPVPVKVPSENDEQQPDELSLPPQNMQSPQRPRHEIKPPAWHKDYILTGQVDHWTLEGFIFYRR